ncbi:MAG: glutaredoxin family protein [Gaiellaceae bacterium]
MSEPSRGWIPSGVMELYQAEWCPHSHRVRQRLTELGLDFVAHQVAVDPAERTQLDRVSGQRNIPALVLNDGSFVSGDEEIIAALNRRFLEPPAAARHREKAIEEWSDWLRLASSR